MAMKAILLHKTSADMAGWGCSTEWPAREAWRCHPTLVRQHFNLFFRAPTSGDAACGIGSQHATSSGRTACAARSCQ